MIPNKQPVPLQRDPLFYLAVLAGMLVWAVLYLLTMPVIDWQKPLRYPLWFLQLVVLYPLLEEWLFRGQLQEFLRERLPSSFGPLSMANLLTSVMFTAAHFFFHPPLAAALVIFPSLVFGFFKDRTRALSAPILLHGFYNAGYLWLFATPA